MKVEPPTSNSSGDSAFPACRTSHPTTKAYSAPDLLCPQATLKLSRGRVEGKSPRPLLFCRVASAAPNYLPWRGRPAPACHTYPPPGDCSKPVSPATLSTEAPLPHPCLHRKKKKVNYRRWSGFLLSQLLTVAATTVGRSVCDSPATKVLNVLVACWCTKTTSSAEGIREPHSQTFGATTVVLLPSPGFQPSRVVWSLVHACNPPFPHHQLSSACTRRRLTSFLSTPASHLRAPTDS